MVRYKILFQDLLSNPVELISLGIHVLSLITSFIFSIILARYLGPELFGKYSYLLSWIAVGVSFISGGLSSLLTREIAVYKEGGKIAFISGIFSVSLTVITINACLLILITISFYSFEKYHLELVLIALGSIVLLAITMVYNSVLRGLGYVVNAQLSSKIVVPILRLLFILCVVVFYHESMLTVDVALYIFISTAFFGFIVSFFLFNKNKSKSGIKTNRKDYALYEWSSSFWKLSLLGWMGALNMQLSVLLLGYLGDDIDVAKYKVAVQIASLIPFGLMVMNAIQMPEMSKAFHKKERQKLQQLASRNCLVSLIVALPIIGLGLFYGEELILFLFGSAYVNTGFILFVLVLGQIVNVSAGSTGILMLVSRKEHTVMITQGSILLVNVVLCFLLIPRMGALGAALASGVSLSLRNIFLIFYIYKKMGILSLPNIKSFKKL